MFVAPRKRQIPYKVYTASTKKDLRDFDSSWWTRLFADLCQILSVCF